MCKDVERENLEKGQRVLMKIMAIDKKNNTNMLVLPDWAPKNSMDRDQKMTMLGFKIKDLTKDLKTLVLVSDTFYARMGKDPSKLSPAEQIIFSDMANGKRRLEDLPPELHKYRGEALMIFVSTDGGETMEAFMTPYTVKDKKVEFGKDEKMAKTIEDNMLTSVWKGYHRA